MAEESPTGGYPTSVSYKVFKRRHPSYDEKQWRICRALYAGGRDLLADRKVMQEVFPQHSGEPPEVYQERVRRAYFLPYPGEIIDSIVAALTSAPVTMVAEDADGEADETVDAFYSDFFEDVSKPGGRKQSLNQLLREQILTALQCRTAWTLVDLPTEDAAPQTYAEQVESGALDAYACPVAPEDVCDWEEDGSGELEWALIRTQENRRTGLEDSRDDVRETWTYYDRDGWARYVVTYKVGDPPADDREVALEAAGNHSFGRVPLVRLELPKGLAAMQKIESVAIAHFNARNALEWAKIKSLLPTPVAFLQSADPMNPVSSDDARAVQSHAVGRIRVLAADDRLEYFAPDSAPFAFAGEDLATLRDEMHRVLHHMALSVDNSGAALQRSADSKAIDQAAAAVVLGALGVHVREHSEEIYSMVQVGRADERRRWAAHGMDDFEDTTSGALIEQAMNLETVQIPSATFQVEYRFSVAKRLLGAKASRETLQKVREELEAHLTQDQFDVEAEAKAAEDDLRRRQAENAPDSPEGENLP